MSEPPLVMGPVVVGSANADLAGVISEVEGRGGVIRAHHQVSDDRAVVEFDGPADQGHGTTTNDLVKALRQIGLAAVDGPRSAGHAVAWARRNAPVEFGPGAAVCFPWTVIDRSRFDLVVEIDPGMGFGAGGHPTTTLLLRRLLQTELTGRRVLDVGCGTGVLGITAALLGADSVVAVDVALAALRATSANAERNGVDDRLIVSGDSLDQITATADIVLANIHADILIELAPQLRRLTAEHGLLALSGLSPAQPSAVIAALEPMRTGWTDESADWVALGLGWPEPE